MCKKTPLYNRHVELGGKIVPFAGYYLPVQYKTGVVAEIAAVRTNVGIFDVSHMGELWLEGKDAFDNLQNILTNDFASLEVGRIRYSPMCYENGGCVDDLLVYKFSQKKFLLVVNASNKNKDYDWIKANLKGEATIADDSQNWAQMAIQGRNAGELLKEVSLPQKYYSFKDGVMINQTPCLVSKTGYTGEGGYEIYCPARKAQDVFDLLVERGAIPCGLGARDVLRLEAAMPLYGHELSEEITPAEAGLGFAIKQSKPSFIGKEGLLFPKRKRIGLRITSRGIAREGAKVFCNDKEIGIVTSGTQSPTLGYALAMAYVPAEFDKENVKIEVRGNMLEAELVSLPFYTIG